MPRGLTFIHDLVFDSNSALSKNDSANAPNHRPHEDGIAR